MNGYRLGLLRMVMLEFDMKRTPARYCRGYSNLIFRARFMPVAALTSGVRNTQQ